MFILIDTKPHFFHFVIFFNRKFKIFYEKQKKCLQKFFFYLKYNLTYRIRAVNCL